MSFQIQRELFPTDVSASGGTKSFKKQPAARDRDSGTFSDNLRQPVHRWFKYSAGFSAAWAATVIKECQAAVVLDPFVGSGTVCVASDMVGVCSFGVEAHPFVERIARGKVSWDADVDSFLDASQQIIELAQNERRPGVGSVSGLLEKCYTPNSLMELLAIRYAYEVTAPYMNQKVQQLIYLAICAVLRPVSCVGTAQWQYVLPKKIKARPVEAAEAFRKQIKVMAEDMAWAQARASASSARIINGDARKLEEIPDDAIDLVITSPPYANNYDYADAARLEMTFWGEVSGWGDLHEAARKHLVRSSSQHVSKDRLSIRHLLTDDILEPIKEEISSTCAELEAIKETKGGKKNYDAMVAAYFVDMGATLRALRRVLSPGGKMCWVVGDSAPYGIYVPVERWLGKLAIANGFSEWSFEKIRDRNMKWKNRKHRVPLHEGRLWIKG